MWKEDLRQFLKYLLIGAMTNSVGYLVYILMTGAGVPPKITITIIYCLAATIGFFANKDFTFGYEGKFISAGVRYLMVQVLGYFLNLSMLMIFSDQLGFNHRLIQGGAIIVVAIFLFFASRLYVFSKISQNSE